MFYRFHPFRDKSKPERPEAGNSRPGLPPKVVNALLAIVLIGSAVFSLALLAESLLGTHHLSRFPVRIEKLWQPSLTGPLPDSTRKDSTTSIPSSKVK